MFHTSDLPIAIQADSYCSWAFPSFQSGRQQRQPPLNLGNLLIWSRRGSQTTRRNDLDILLSHTRTLGESAYLGNRNAHAAQNSLTPSMLPQAVLLTQQAIC